MGVCVRVCVSLKENEETNDMEEWIRTKTGHSHGGGAIIFGAIM